MIAAALVALAALAAPAEAPPGAPPKTAARATAPATAALRPFGFEDVRKVAQERAKREFRPAQHAAADAGEPDFRAIS